MKKRLIINILLFFIIFSSRSFGENAFRKNLEDLKQSKYEVNHNRKKLESIYMSKEGNLNKLLIPNDYFPMEHQEYLYTISRERKLNYIKTLAILKHESQFKENALSHTKDYGYMQINTVNHERLSQTLNTPLDPYNPYVNINWGTYVFAELYNMYRDRGYIGYELDWAVWSSYNRGIAGYNKYGNANRYIERTISEINWIKQNIINNG